MKTEFSLTQLADPDIAGQSEALTVLRLEGITASAAHRAGSLRELLAPFGTATLVEDVASAAAWATVRDVLPFAASGALGAWPVWRIVCPPASGAALGTLLARETGGELIYDWGGGLVWAALPPTPDAHAPAVRERVRREEIAELVVDERDRESATE